MLVCHLPVFEVTWIRKYKDALALAVKATSRAHLHTNTRAHLYMGTAGNQSFHNMLGTQGALNEICLRSMDTSLHKI